jgi:hypothetical protein
MAIAASAVAVVVALGLTSGCGGPQGTERVAVSGKVQFDGKPLSTGRITFIPQGKGAAVSGQITDGAFTIAKEQGPAPGKCRVEIMSSQETGKKGPTGPEVKQIIPARYNANSKLEAVLDAKDAKPCEFNLVSK